jgi:hypothetical protein
MDMEAEHQMTKEEWRDVICSPGYKVSDLGRVIGLRGRVLVPGRHGQKGYQAIRKTKGAFYIHTAVLEAFVCPRPDGLEARHLDGDHDNNTVGNLAWGTKSDNMQDMIAHGRTLQGEKHHKARLTAEQVTAMRAAYAHGLMNGMQLAAVYGVSFSHAYSILRRETWAHD